MNSLVSRFSIVLCSVVFLFSCGEKEEAPASLQLSTEEIRAAASGGTFNLAIASNVSWKVILTGDWVEASPAEGFGDEEVIFSVKENSDEAVRSLDIRVTGGGIVRTLTVSQAAAEPEFPSYHIPADHTGMRDISSLELAADMGVGWNLGNSLEAIGGETAWGNPKVTQALIDQIQAAGFNAVRIPVAWSKFANATDFTIDPAWMARVQEVVDYVVGKGMYAVLNQHWDEGWMQPTYAQQAYVNGRLEKMWIQIALHFRHYDDHLLFAGTNEVMVTGDYGTPKAEYYTVQNSFNQTFVEAVRSTGGRNAHRNLVVQTFNTNIDHGINFFALPEDATDDRLMVEVHYYDPYEFVLKEEGGASQWGKNATDPVRKAAWGDESHVDAQFKKLKGKFVDQGIPVLVGEYGVISRTALSDHEQYRKDYLDYVSASMKAHGLVPFYWDNGHAGNYGFALFDRNTGTQLYPDLIRAIVGK
ncbi:cellulase family glycosylhydrolase [Algoriphagus sp. H41]|uniref:Cellulase family glycosylhydrolase n=1 Tax=Algoriphagus oliviformis TaxID=2811231 RepID=A0ABS3C0H3_9BACT|nr:cellulase family glycosylhydrolase [Algoriphagus oliviformis]MBN7810620.1 cellulase family glycosylhydrolase [Algoriphagus oliviformis]